MKQILAIWFVISLLFVTNHVGAQDWPKESWPQWGGPDRNHKSRSDNLLQQWPTGGPPVAWKFTNAGVGYSACAVIDGKLFTMGTIDGNCFLICLDTTDGSELWRTSIGAALPDGAYRQGWGAGPRGTPSIAGDRVIALDDAGNLACVDRHTGKLNWQLNLVDDFDGELPKWGYSESPLIDGDRVVVCPGNSQYLVALDVATGNKLFSSAGFDYPPHYASVVKHEVDGIPMYIAATVEGLVGFSANNGAVLWQNMSSGNATATIPTPIVQGKFVYHTSAYSTGCVLIELSVNNDKVVAREVYFNKNMQNHHGSVILVNNLLFGVRKSGGWLCQDFLTGEIVWSERISGDSSASATFADNRFYIYGESSGACYLVEPSSQGWIEHGKLTLPEQTKLDRKSGKIWSHPVVAEGKLFLRDLDLIYAFDISK